MLADLQPEDRSLVDVQVIPGITALSMAGSMVGSPIAQDFAVISLSDRFLPWNQIEKRLEAVAGADMVIALYEPSSRHRPGQLAKAQALLLRHRDGGTPVTVAREVTKTDETLSLTTLEMMTEFAHDKRTVIIVGNSKTKIVGDWMITPREY
jgi:precorrin-3B C17-methyltransferase